jgi:ABC-type transport system involved in Fe-S cluster assembly fused permease/ATPase subunit
LSLAETVASFGAIALEEERYASALARVSKSSMKVRYSFSLLKLMQSIILGTGAGMLIFVTWKTSTTELLAGNEPGYITVAEYDVLFFNMSPHTKNRTFYTATVIHGEFCIVTTCDEKRNLLKCSL